MKILFICKQKTNNCYGITGLYNSARFVVDALSKIHETKLVRVIDSNGIDKEMYSFKPDIVVLEAVWVPPSKLKELSNLPRYKSVQWLVRVHSKPAFLAHEGQAIKYLYEYANIPNVTISGNTEEFSHVMSIIDVNSICLPNIYSKPFTNVAKKFDKYCLDIGCFGAIRPMKNHVPQAIAAISFGRMMNKQVRFHINATRIEQSGDGVLKNLRVLFANTEHELIEHPWMEHDDFYQLVSQMDMGLQVSLSETFNIVSADFVSQNVPIVTSSEVPFVNTMYHAEPNDIYSIIDGISFVYYTKFIGLHTINQYYLNQHNKLALTKWKEFLK